MAKFYQMKDIEVPHALKFVSTPGERFCGIYWE
jgi:hypothetical protein